MGIANVRGGESRRSTSLPFTVRWWITTDTNGFPIGLSSRDLASRENSLPLSQFYKGVWAPFLIWVALAALCFWKQIVALIQLSLRDDTFSYIPLIPLIFCWLLYSDRKQPADPTRHSLKIAALLLIPAAVTVFLAIRCSSCASVNRLSLYTLALILIWISGFVLFMGIQKSHKSLFSLCFLFLAVPIPDFLLSKITYYLQAGSAEIAEAVFGLSGAPVLRDGFIFRLPKITIDIAPECSGIRSSMALLIIALLLAHFAFGRLWKKVAFVMAGLCMMLIKNGIRIATLTLLANYVNPDFLYGNLHHEGGVVFFLLGLALLVPVFSFLRKGESGVAPRTTS
jgi:exosortase